MKNKMNRLFYLSILISLSIGCINSNKIDPKIKVQTDKLETLEDRETYLTKIFEDDQSVRQSNSELIKLNHGEDSKEYFHSYRMFFYLVLVS